MIAKYQCFLAKTVSLSEAGEMQIVRNVVDLLQFSSVLLRVILAIKEIGYGPVAVWCRSFDSISCNKGDELWEQAEPMNSARTRCADQRA